MLPRVLIIDNDEDTSGSASSPRQKSDEVSSPGNRHDACGKSCSPRNRWFGNLPHNQKATPYCSIPLLIISARTDPDVRARGLSAGAEAFLGKPITPHDLLTKVRNYFKPNRNRKRIQ